MSLTSLRVVGCVPIIAAAVGIGAVARAQDPGAAIAVRVDAESKETCATGQAFLVELETRDPRVRAATPNERAPLLVVRVARTPRGKDHGRLVVEDTDGTVSRREVDGDTCESVLSALALMSAIAVDPSLRPPDPALPASDPAGGGAAPDPLAKDAGDARGEAGGRAHAEVSRDAPSADSGRPPSDGPHVSFSGGAGATTGTAPTVVLMVPVSFDVTWGRPASVAPLLRGGFEHTNSGDDAASGGSVRFVLNAGTLDVCARLPFGARLQVLPCLHAEGGALTGTGLDITPGRTDTTPWAALGALGSARYRFLSVVFAEFTIGLRLPLLRDRFYFEPDTTVFRPPPLSAFASAGLGLTIP